VLQLRCEGQNGFLPPREVTALSTLPLALIVDLMIFITFKGASKIFFFAGFLLPVLGIRHGSATTYLFPPFHHFLPYGFLQTLSPPPFREASFVALANSPCCSSRVFSFHISKKFFPNPRFRHCPGRMRSTFFPRPSPSFQELPTLTFKGRHLPSRVGWRKGVLPRPNTECLFLPILVTLFQSRSV